MSKHDSWPENTRLLVVDDNKANQMVAKGLLKRIGLQADIAEDGAEALKCLQGETAYSLVLMDCQMPIMDGYEATEAIRSGKAGDEIAHIPIIAMTANALQGDKDKCLQAGMSDYLTKPIDMNLLKEKIQSWLISSAPKASQQVPTIELMHSAQENRVISELAIWDKPSVLKRVMDDEELLLTVVEIFLDDIPNNTASLEQAIAMKDFPLIKRVAHGIKGSAANLSCMQLQELALQIENAAKAENIAKIVSVFSDLLQVNKQLTEHLQQYLLMNAKDNEPLELFNQADLNDYFSRLAHKLRENIYIDEEELSQLNKVSTMPNMIILVEQLQMQIQQINNDKALLTLAKLAAKMNCELKGILNG